jgi:hypothetical protein
MAGHDRTNTGGGRDAGGPPANGEVERAGGYGLSMTLIGGVLLTLSYYAVLAFRSGQLSGFSLPEPVYLLAIAFLFVLELLKSRRKGLVALLRATLFAAVFGVLLVLGVEGVIYLANSPAVALEGFAGVTVLSVMLVVAALGYFTYKSVVLFDRRKRVRG